MGEIYNKFLKDSERKAFDLEHRSKILFNISKYDQAVELGKKNFSNLNLARKRASNIKHRVINHLDKYLIEFVANFEKNGGKVIWATNAEEAVKEILAIAKKQQARLVVKSKSMTTEEIELNEAFLKNGIDVVETDLGEYIVQVAGEKPYHIVTPAMHKSRDDVAQLFHNKLNTPRESSPEALTAFVREKLRTKFIDADLGITGCNFLIADTGAVCITENEGNALMSVAFPRIHIAIAGIEKIIPSLADLDLFWPLLATFGTGQRVTAYNSIITGPRKEDEKNGPEEMYLILLENNRSEVLKYTHQRAAMKCIRCGACLNVCPVYKNIGGHTYNATYSGPIGSVITPIMKGFEQYKHLSYASSLCGGCTNVCPVEISVHELLLYNRNEAVMGKHISFRERVAMNTVIKTVQKRKRIDLVSSRLKNIGMKALMAKFWGSRRQLPTFAEKSFREMWMEKNQDKIR